MSRDHATQEDRSIPVVVDETPETPSPLNIVGDEVSAESCANVLECFICMETPSAPVAASCGHVFCWACLHRWLDNQPKPCPVCRYTVRRDLDVIPLYGAGSGAGAQASNKNGNRSEITNSNSITPPRPRNPLLVEAPASTDSEATEFESSLSGVIFGLPRDSLLASYERRIYRLSASLSVERARVHNLGVERTRLDRKVSALEHRNADLRQEVKDRESWRLRVNSRLEQCELRLRSSEQQNWMLSAEVQASRERERRLFEWGKSGTSEIMDELQQRLDRASLQEQGQGGFYVQEYPPVKDSFQ